MIFRQLFDKESSTFTYLMASRNGGEALLIDPVLEQTGRYLKLLEELGQRLPEIDPSLPPPVNAPVLYRRLAELIQRPWCPFRGPSINMAPMLACIPDEAGQSSAE